MARGDLIKEMFRSYKAGDSAAFLDAANEIIVEERKKHHTILANELTRIIDNGVHPQSIGFRSGFADLPKDTDRGAPLLEIRQPDRYLRDLVLSDEQVDILDEVIREFTHWDILECKAIPGK